MFDSNFVQNDFFYGYEENKSPYSLVQTTCEKCWHLGPCLVPKYFAKLTL